MQIAKCKTILTYFEHLALNKAIFRVRTLPIIIIYDSIVFLLALFMFFGVKMYGFGVFLLFIIVFYTGTVILMNKKNVKKIFNSSEAFKNSIEYLYEFLEEEMNVEAVSKVSKMNGSLRYSSIYKIIETKDYLFLFVNHINAHIVIKEAIDKKELNLLKKTLKSFVKKYKIIK